jgi:hypothetical protein
VNILDPPVRLIDALSGWGLREVAVKYPGMEVPSAGGERTMLGMNVVLRHVPLLIARILLAEPLDVAEPRSVLRIEFDPEESANFYLWDGTPLAEYTDRASTDATPKFGQYVRWLVQSPDVRPLVCAVQVAEEDTDRLVGPAVVYDGWHRAAAWLIRVRGGDSCRLTVDLIKTKHCPLVRLSSG